MERKKKWRKKKEINMTVNEINKTDINMTVYKINKTDMNMTVNEINKTDMNITVNEISKRTISYADKPIRIEHVCFSSVQFSPSPDWVVGGHDGRFSRCLFNDTK